MRSGLYSAPTRPLPHRRIKGLGLSVFIAVTGMAAGPDAGPLLKRRPLLLLARILIGAIVGQQCSTPAITAVGNVANSSVPMLGYTITYTLSNFLLPLTGPILVGVIGLRM